ncbi:MAG: hypothetical protein GXY83_38550 [Rhodopirellula sp.]|nr:hypothetical protein [Rhodopirellula sp.]
MEYRARPSWDQIGKVGCVMVYKMDRLHGLLMNVTDRGKLTYRDEARGRR